MSSRKKSAKAPSPRLDRWSSEAPVHAATGTNGDAVEADTTKHLRDDFRKDTAAFEVDDKWVKLTHGDVTIAAITSCTNTSNPQRDGGRRIAREKSGRKRTARAPLRENIARARQPRGDGLSQQGRTDALSRSAWVSTPSATAAPPASATAARCPKPSPTPIDERDLVVAAVLSGNRNFEGRINPHVKANYLASPPLVVAFALAGTRRCQSDG